MEMGVAGCLSKTTSAFPFLFKWKWEWLDAYQKQLVHFLSFSNGNGSGWMLIRVTIILRSIICDYNGQIKTIRIIKTKFLWLIYEP